MIVIGLRFMCLPVAVALWALDALLFVVVLRLVLPRTPYAALGDGLAPFTDPLVECVIRWLPNTKCLRPPARWALVILCLVALRTLFFAVLLLFAHENHAP